MDIADILKEYPFLKRQQIQAAIDFAASVVKKEEKYIFSFSKKASHEVSR